MGVRRLSSRLSGRRVAQQRNEEKAKMKEEKARKEALKKKRKPIEVQVQILTGRPITIHVSPDDTIEEVTYKIKMKEGICPDQQMLLFNGIKLDSDMTVDEYNIRQYASLFLTLRNRGG